MSLTINNIGGNGASIRDLRSIGNTDIVVKAGTIDFDSSYPTGGEYFDITGYFPKGIVSNVMIGAKSGYIFEYDGDNKKIKAYGAEAIPSGTVSQPTLTGDSLSLGVEEEDIASITINRIYHDTVTGGPFQASEVITGGTSNATAVINAVGAGYLDIEDIGLDAVYDLTDELLTDYIAHCADGTAHTTADIVNNDPTALADRTWASIYASLISLKAKYNAHDTETGTYHPAAGTAHQISSADATTHATASTLDNEIKTDYTAHIADAVAHNSADTTNTVSTSDSGITLETAETLTGGTSGATADTTTTVIDVWELANTPASVQNILENTDTMLDILSPSVTLASGDSRVHLVDNKIETLLSDGYTALKVTYAKEATPTGTVSQPNFSGAEDTFMAEVANATALTMTLKATIIGLEGEI